MVIGTAPGPGGADIAPFTTALGKARGTGLRAGVAAIAARQGR